MKIASVAAALESLYYNGRVKVDKKLDRADFIVLVRMAHGNVLRVLFKEQVAYGEILAYYSQHVDRRIYPVGDADKKGRRYVQLDTGDDSGVLKLPRGLGIWGVAPVTADKCDCEDFVRGLAGIDWLLCGPDFEGMQWFTVLGNRLELHGAPECLKEVEVVGIHSDEEIDIPYDIAFDIINMVMNVSFKTKGYPVDKTDNANPNVEEINRRLNQTS